MPGSWLLGGSCGHAQGWGRSARGGVKNTSEDALRGQGWERDRCPAVPAVARVAYRRMDEGSDPSQNHDTFEAARRVLVTEGAIAIFPEGISHSDPKLRPLKTGTARIALGAAALLGASAPLR